MHRCFTAVVLFLLVAIPSTAQIDPELLAGMKARSIGPASMSGRIADIVAVESNPDIFYVGVSTGGVWKTVNAGVTFEPIFDDQPVAAIGAIAVNQQNPDIIWVGTGESNVRNSASVGNGIYRSIDAGRTWTHIGLPKSERIARIVLHPSNPDVAWVAALGPAWGDGGERGVYRTDDGGRSWKAVLQGNERTGAADLAIDPSNPQKLIASMWEYRRWPWFFHSGGPGSGLFITHDGGATWKRLTEEDGLPKGELGRNGVAFSRSNPSTVYALVEAEKSAMLRSTDGGRKWETMNEEPNVNSRPFYYADIRVDPKEPNRVYSLATLVRVSEDGGKTFGTLIPYRKIHPDHHAMWIDPADPSHIIEGNDGGVSISRDRGTTWQYVFNLPLGQYYHISVDMETPYNVYGGMQDNGSWVGPSAVWENGGIRNHHWQEVGFGDGFATLAIPTDTTTGYSMSQEGNLRRWNLKTGEQKSIRPAPPEGAELRFNWNTGIAIDPFDANTVYYGSQFLHKSPNRGDDWTIISPDLTTNNPAWQHQSKSGGLTFDATGAENFTTIITIAPSALERGVIWVGTDDGRVQLTRDGGGSWASVEANIKDVPKNSWVAHVEPSKFDAAEAFAVFDNHRRSDWTPYVFRTTDYGKTWTNLASRDVRGYALVLEQDPVKRDLLFLGTEFGLWVSLDGGKQWMQWTHGFPTVSAMAMTVHPRDHDLVVGTHGRSAYILDDVRPLRTMTREILAKPVHLFEIPDAIQHTVAQTGGERFPGDSEFRGGNEPYGATLTFVLNAGDLPHPKEALERERKEKERATKLKPRIAATGVPDEPKDLPSEPLPELEGDKRDDARGPRAEITIRDAAGNVIRTFKAPVTRGVNRATWNLTRDTFKQPPRERPEWREEPNGPEVLPGTYAATVKYEEQEASAPLRILPDPRRAIADADRKAKWEALMSVGALNDRAVTAIERIQRTRGDIGVILGRLKKANDASAKTREDPTRAELRKSAAALQRRLDFVERLYWVQPNTKGIVDDSTTALARIDYAEGSLSSTWDAPTSAQRAYVARAEETLKAAESEVEKLYSEDVARFREAVRAAKIDLLTD